MSKKSKSGLPSRIECTKCGDKKGVRPDVLQKRIAKFGSLKQLQDVYVCRSCKKELNLDGAFRVKVAKRNYRKASEKSYKSIDPNDGKLKYFWEHRDYRAQAQEDYLRRHLPHMFEDEHKEPMRYGPACHRPDLNLAQNKFCGTMAGEHMCPLYDLCDCPAKKLAKFPKLIVGKGKKTKNKLLKLKPKKKK